MKSKEVNYTVGEFIEKLRQFPESTPVFVSGYENGYENPMMPRLIKVKYIKESKSWDGEFQEVEHEGGNSFVAVVLDRTDRLTDD